MREIFDHKGSSPVSDKLSVTSTDVPGHGGAYHYYSVSGFDLRDNTSVKYPPSNVHRIDIFFQNGPVPEAGVNGVTEQALLAIVIDRLRSFQAGPVPCRENALAITKLEEAMHWINHRTLDRQRRGVEGSLQK